MKSKWVTVVVLMFCQVLGSCYKMRPEDEATRTVPTTNNPQLRHETMAPPFLPNNF